MRLPRIPGPVYQCDVIRFQPAFSGTPQVFLSLSKLDLTGAGTIVLESIDARVAKVSWNSFQPEVNATGWTDNSRSKHIEVHQSGNLAPGLPSGRPRAGPEALRRTLRDSVAAGSCWQANAAPVSCRPL